MTRFFGHRYLAGMYEDAPEIPPPVGLPCEHCEELFTADDDGIVIGGQTVLPDGSTGAPFHRACFLRTIIGSVAHVEGRCSCFVRGSSEHDPPEITKRQAAELALRRYYELSPWKRRTDV